MGINDTVWVIEEPKKKAAEKEELPKRAPIRPKLLKSPATAFSLSMIIWGAGQLYNNQRKLGYLFLISMTLFHLYLVSMLLFWDSITATCTEININPSQIILVAGILYAAGLLLWITSACQAYYKAAKMRYNRFRGIDSALLPTLGSFVFPGWGQFLNGQPVKGILFTICSLVGFFVLAAVIFIPIVWPSLDTSIDRYFFENILSFALYITPILALIWLINICDSLIVSRDFLKKEPLKRRMEYAFNNCRTKGWKRAILPRMKLALMLTLFLIFSLTISYSYFPKEYYVNELQNLQKQLSQREMVIIPEQIGQFLDWLAS